MARMNIWLEAARPRTLTASLSPVMVGAALAYHDGVFRGIPALLCLLVALFAQVGSNFANDYFDFQKGADREDRLGPARAVACGWIAPGAMLRATLLMLALSSACGCLLLFYAGWELIPVGIAIVLFALAYTAGPFPLAYNGLGDVCVLLFFGIVPVSFTYYVQALHFTGWLWWLALGVGVLSMNILIVNNYRDYAQDKASGKYTTVVWFGRRFAERFYLLNQFVALACVWPLLKAYPRFGWLFAGCLFLFLHTWWEMRRHTGKALNRTLGHTARNVLIYALCVAVVLIASAG